MNGEGSWRPRQTFLYSSADRAKFKAAVKRMAHVDCWQDDPSYGRVPRHEEGKMAPIDESYRL